MATQVRGRLEEKKDPRVWEQFEEENHQRRFWEVQKGANWGTEADEVAEMQEVKVQLEAEEEENNPHPLVG